MTERLGTLAAVRDNGAVIQAGAASRSRAARRVIISREASEVVAVAGAASAAPAPDSAPVIATLPMPPSANALFKQVGRRRVVSRQYADWKGHAGWVLRAQRAGRVAGPYLVVISVERLQANSDIDNRVKAILDLLVREKVTDDDSNLVGFCIAWAPAGQKLARVMVLPAADYSFDFHLANDRTAGGWFLQVQPEKEIA